MRIATIYPKGEDAIGTWVGKAAVYVLAREGIVVAKIPEGDAESEVYLYVDKEDKIWLSRTNAEGKRTRAEVTPEAYERHILAMLEGMVSEIKLTAVDVKEVVS